MNTVAAVGANDREAICLGVLLDDVSQLTVLHTGLAWLRKKEGNSGKSKIRGWPNGGLTGLDGLLEALSGGVDELAALLVHVAHEVGLVEVRVVAVKVDADVDVDNIAVLEGPEVGNAVADDLVHGPRRKPQ